MTKAKENTGKPCPYRAIMCDGLCNNCGLNVISDGIIKKADQCRINPGDKWYWYGCDYEEAILARQEEGEII